MDRFMIRLRNLALIGCTILFAGLHLSRALTLGVLTIQKSNAEEGRHENNRVREKLKSVWAGDGRASDGTLLELNSYETTGGIHVGVTRGKFSSPAAAQNELDLWAKHATKIMLREVRKDSSGQPIGVRAFGVFPSAKAHEEYNAVLWTDGGTYYWVSSPSLELALQIEEELNNHSFHQRLEPAR
jgi:hypothetical protein